MVTKALVFSETIIKVSLFNELIMLFAAGQEVTRHSG